MASGSNINRQVATPLNIPRTRRNHAVATLTSFDAGVMAPVAVFPMLREDAFSGRFSIAVEMMETHEFVMNPVNLRVMAYCVPWLALPRFEGSRDQFDRSYSGIAQIEGGSVIPFFDTDARGADGANAVYDTLGLHAPTAKEVNNMYLQAYNLIWNFRAKNRSKELTERAMTATSLAPAFWQHSRFEHILPDFDQAVIDGEVALNLVDINLAGTAAVTRTGTGNVLIRRASDASLETNGNLSLSASGILRESSGSDAVQIDPNGTLQVSLAGLVAELEGAGVSMSLSNLELARKTQVFAKLREQFEGHDDEYIIDMLMNGLSIPDQALKNPILIADRTVRISQAKRYATDAANLAASAVSGGAQVDLSLRVPRLSVGGVVMVVVEAVPEQLFERQSDPFFYVDAVADLPEFLRDHLDPEKVDVVLNGDIDTMHTSPNNTFGYAPMNWKWNSFGPRIGGKFYKPSSGTANDTERRRLWGVETTDPVLSTSFYIVNSIHQKPFINTTADPFELVMTGNAVIEGHTVFGGLLAEDTGNYDAVLAEADQTRIDQS